MAENSKIAYLLERLAQGVAAHDRENPGHHSWGIGMAYFDIERLGLEEGEQILPGIVLQADGGVTGAFRVLCDGEHDQELAEEEEEIVEAIAAEERELDRELEEERELQPVEPWRGSPPPLRPPL
jgi:hypothetical protein